jgi:hypothetical protein
MSQQAKELSERLQVFSNQVIDIVENLSEEDWNKVCTWEEWSVGVTARHIGAGHLNIIWLAKMIINGEELPELTMDKIFAMANEHAKEHADCTRDEVLDILRQNGAALVDFVAGLNEDELDRKGYIEATDGDVSVQQLIEFIIFQSAGEHFANIKTATSA